jgi:hypothetical protein
METTMSDLRADVRRLADAAEKLLHETERLRRDVAILHGRIQPFTGEVPLPEPEFTRQELKWPVRDAINLISRARGSILACEQDLSAIRARMDSIESDAISREEMKPWLKS